LDREETARASPLVSSPNATRAPILPSPVTFSSVCAPARRRKRCR